MRVFLFDTNVFVYATGTEHAYRAPCQRILKLQGEGNLAGEASIELVHEFANICLRRGRSGKELVRQSSEVADACVKVHPLEWRDMHRALELMSSGEGLRSIDAVHAATALNRGIEFIVSADKGFDQVTGLTRIDPLDQAAVDSLL